MPVHAISNIFPSTPPDTNAQSRAAGAKKKSVADSNEDSQKIRELADTDRKVRAHEAAHMAAGGQYVKGGATFQFQKGPDGKMYAVGGEVSIDTSPVKSDPQATIMKMEAVKRAAMAPAEPSGQDRSVASAASAAEAQARQELAAQTTNTGTSKNESALLGSLKSNESNKAYLYTKKGDGIYTPPGQIPPLLAVA